MSPNDERDAVNSVTSATATETPRRRLHKSAYVFAALATVSLLLANIPGQLDFGHPTRIIDSWVVEFNTFQRADHGWPMTYLRRDLHSLFQGPSQPSLKLAIWNLSSGIIAFSPLALLVNVITALAVICGITWLFELRRRRRNRVWQLHLIDLLAVTTAIGLTLGWWTHRARRHESEFTKLATVPGSCWKDWTPGGWSWLRHLMGELPLNPQRSTWPYSSNGSGFFCIFDEPESLASFGLKPSEDRQFFEAIRDLPSVRSLHILGSNRTIPKLAIPSILSLTELQSLSFLQFQMSSADLHALQALERLEHLSLYSSTFSENAVDELARFTSLKVLILSHSNLTDADIVKLKRLLPNCEIRKSAGAWGE